MLTQARLQELFTYDNGCLHFRTKSFAQGVVGARAGFARKKDKYRQLKVDGKAYLEHRVIWLYHHGHWPDKDLDHINGVRDDNRICNLRLATRAENNRNTCIRSTNRSGVKNVCYDTESRKWLVSLRIAGRQAKIGRFHDLELAALVATEYRDRAHGSFARA